MNKEIIWSLQFSEDESLRENGNQTHLYFVPKYDANIPGMTRTVEYGRPYARFKPTQFMSDLYDSSIDSRYQAYWRDTWYATTATDQSYRVEIQLFIFRKMLGAKLKSIRKL